MAARRSRRKNKIPQTKAKDSYDNMDNKENIKEDLFQNTGDEKEREILDREYAELRDKLDKTTNEISEKYIQIMQYGLKNIEEEQINIEETDNFSSVEKLQKMVKEYEQMMREKENYEAQIDEKAQEIDRITSRIQTNNKEKGKKELLKELENKKAYIEELDLELKKEMEIFRKEKELQKKVEKELMTQAVVLKEIKKSLEILKENNKKQEKAIMEIEEILIGLEGNTR